jgi:NADPH:quinone reductase-like Zn-dependent oxidoreductase
VPRTYVYTAFGGPENQEFLDLPRPDPGAGQLLVKVHAAGVNPADWKQRANFRNSPDPLKGPTPMGLEVAGVVEELGAEVSGFAVGDEVFGSLAANGGFSEYSVLPVAIAAHKPPAVSFVDAATLPVAAATAYDGVQQLGLQPEETLLIIGIGGGVGIAAAQIAIAKGARVIGTASAEKKALVESVGATHVAYGEGVVERVRAAAPGGIDALYDQVGGAALRELAVLVTDPARIISAGDQAAGVELGGARLERARNAAVLDAVAAMVAAGTLRPHVTEVFPLDKVAEALALVESGHATGKVVVTVA